MVAMLRAVAGAFTGFAFIVAAIAAIQVAERLAPALRALALEFSFDPYPTLRR
jgi:hypothetical protein